MAITAAEIETLIQTALPDADVIVRSDDGHHFAAEVIDESFRGKNRVQQQRVVNAAVKSALDSGALHALALTTRAPE